MKLYFVSFTGQKQWKVRTENSKFKKKKTKGRSGNERKKKIDSWQLSFSHFFVFVAMSFPIDSYFWCVLINHIAIPQHKKWRRKEETLNNKDNNIDGDDDCSLKIPNKIFMFSLYGRKKKGMINFLRMMNQVLSLTSWLN